MSDIKIRPLNVEDRDVLSDMILKLANKAGNDFLQKFIVFDKVDKKTEADKKTEDSRYVGIFLQIVNLLFSELKSDIRGWFASLVEKTPEEFKKLPFDTEINILEQLTESREANDFFIRALRLYRKMQGLAEQSENKKKA